MDYYEICSTLFEIFEKLIDVSQILLVFVLEKIIFWNWEFATILLVGISSKILKWASEICSGIELCIKQHRKWLVVDLVFAVPIFMLIKWMVIIQISWIQTTIFQMPHYLKYSFIYCFRCSGNRNMKPFIKICFWNIH